MANVVDPYVDNMVGVAKDLAAEIFYVSGSVISVSLIVVGYILVPESNRDILRKIENITDITQASRRFLRWLGIHFLFGIAASCTLHARTYSNTQVLVLGIVIAIILLLLYWRLYSAIVYSRSLTVGIHPTVKFLLGLVYIVFNAVAVLFTSWTYLIAQAITEKDMETLAFMSLYFTTFLFLFLFVLAFELLNYTFNLANIDDSDLDDDMELDLENKCVVNIDSVNIILSKGKFSRGRKLASSCDCVHRIRNSLRSRPHSHNDSTDAE